MKEGSDAYVCSRLKRSIYPLSKTKSKIYLKTESEKIT